MDYEKKYKESMAKMSTFLSKHDGFTISKDGEMYKELSEIFPELKESEDERIRKHLIKHFGNKSKEDWNGVPVKSILAWLEKQGEQKHAKNIVETWKEMRLEVYQQASGNRHEPNYSDDTTKMFSLNDIDEIIEKMSEQKPTCKVESKFHKGDWVIDKQGIVHQIANVIENVTNHTYGYDIVGGGYFNDNVEGVRLWTIQDAKDGNVLADNVGVILFRKIGNEKYADAVDYHCAVYKSGSFIIQKGLSYWGYSKDEQLRPATKEQCERFFATMRDVGYEWDADKKGLKKLREE